VLKTLTSPPLSELIRSSRSAAAARLAEAIPHLRNQLTVIFGAAAIK
jgi:hypothetical protein